MEMRHYHMGSNQLNGWQALKETSLLLLLSLYGALGLLGKKPLLLLLLHTLRECATGQLLLVEELDVLRQSAQWLHFVFDVLF